METVIPDCAEQIVAIIKKHKFLNGNIFYDVLCLNCKLSDLNSSAITYKIFPNTNIDWTLLIYYFYLLLY